MVSKHKRNVNTNTPRGFAGGGVTDLRRALGVQVVRYADDFVIISRSQHIISRYIKPRVTDFLLERGLTLSSEKTRMFTLEKSKLNFLGYTFQYKNK